MRRLPAHPARLRGRAPGLAGAVRDRPLHRDVPGDQSTAPTTCRLVEGSITTEADAERIQEVRASSTPAHHHRRVRHGRWDPGSAELGCRSSDYVGAVYAHPEYISSLATSTPISAHVDVDVELHGLPDRPQASSSRSSPPTLAGRRPVIPSTRSARSARGAAPCASSSPRARPASARSRGPAAARSAPRSLEAASAASAPPRGPTREALARRLVEDGARSS